MRILTLLFLVLSLSASAADGPVTTAAKSNLVNSVNTAVVPVTNLDLQIIWSWFTNRFVQGSNVMISVTASNVTISAGGNSFNSSQIDTNGAGQVEIANGAVVTNLVSKLPVFQNTNVSTASVVVYPFGPVTGSGPTIFTIPKPMASVGFDGYIITETADGRIATAKINGSYQTNSDLTDVQFFGVSDPSGSPVSPSFSMSTDTTNIYVSASIDGGGTATWSGYINVVK